VRLTPRLRQVKRDRSYRIQDSIETTSDADAVMRLVLSPRTWPRWQSEIQRVEGPDTVEEGDQISGDAELVGFRVQGRSDAHVVGDGLFIEDVIVGVRMVVTYRVEKTARGAVIHRSLEAEMPGGPAGALLTFVLRARLKKMQKRLLRELVAQAEAGV
jgi:Polyketide cyclase / dehydrase and lipid transport